MPLDCSASSTRRTPDECPSRIRSGTPGEDHGARCAVVERITGAADPSFSGVPLAACEACCRSMQAGEDLNPVVASLVYTAAGKILDSGGTPGCDRNKAEQLRSRVIAHLAIVPDSLLDRIFPPEASRAPQVPSASHRANSPGDRLSVGVLTAPRRVPTLAATLRSLHGAGFNRLHIFAEPGSPIPPEAHGHPFAVNHRRLGNFASFYSALATLYRQNEHASGVIIFQDDIEVAAGLKSWCDSQLFPLDCGVASLFTPRAHSNAGPGWRVLSPGRARIWGGQALAFRRDWLEQFLSDPLVLREIQHGTDSDDAVVSSWVKRRGLGIAFHSPSLVQHVGRVSSIWPGGPDPRIVAHAVADVRQIACWKRPRRRPGRVGLVGRAGATGLGYLNRDLARHYEIDRWLIPPEPLATRLKAPQASCRVDHAPLHADPRQISRWLAGLDWVLFVERPHFPALAALARQMGVFIAAVPTWEWLGNHLDWLRAADLLICPTRHTYHYVCDWRLRHGYGWETAHVPWPFDTGYFRFRERRRADQFVFINGMGGHPPRRLDGTVSLLRRKGVEVMVQAMRLSPRLKFLFYSLDPRVPDLPPNVEHRPAPDNNRALYEHGDVCVQPSHLEGLGLQLLECQAAGMPLITTDAPPMNEQEPWAAIPVVRSETVIFGEGHPVPWHHMDPRQLAALLQERAGADIKAASRHAREFIEREHNWSNARRALRELLVIP
jgi:glycosyltransferase involved in cell wall biosynthesis